MGYDGLIESNKKNKKKTRYKNFLLWVLKQLSMMFQYLNSDEEK